MFAARPMIIHTLKIIGDLADNVLNEGTQTKRLCHDCIRDYIDIAHGLFTIYVNDAAVCEELFAFFHIVLDVLKTQVTTTFSFSWHGIQMVSEIRTISSLNSLTIRIPDPQ